MPVSQLDGETTMSIAFDLGMLYDIPGVEGITLGLNVVNLGTVSEDTSQPAGIKLGAGFRDIIKNMNMGIDIEKDFLSDGMAIDLGAEYVLFNKLRPRLGYQLESVNSGLGDSLQGLTAGLGVQTSLANMIMHVDYAYQPFGDIGDTHRIGILIEFGQISTPYKEEKE